MFPTTSTQLKYVIFFLTHFPIGGNLLKIIKYNNFYHFYLINKFKKGINNMC